MYLRQKNKRLSQRLINNYFKKTAYTITGLREENKTQI